MRKLLFLDIDGVLAASKYFDGEKGWTLAAPLLDMFDRIVAKVPDLEIVISSSWRTGYLKKTKEKLAEHGFRHADKIVGETIRGYHHVIKGCHLPIPRGVEVKAWLDLNVRKTTEGFTGQLFSDYVYAILDDDSDFLIEQEGFLCKCRSDTGLTATIAWKVIELLDTEPIPK